MAKPLDVVVDEIRAALAPLPDGYWVKGEPSTNNVIIGTDELAFAITGNDIRDNLYIEHAKRGFPGLVLAVAQYRDLRAKNLEVLKQGHANCMVQYNGSDMWFPAERLHRAGEVDEVFKDMSGLRVAKPYDWRAATPEGIAAEMAGRGEQTLVGFGKEWGG